MEGYVLDTAAAFTKKKGHVVLTALGVAAVASVGIALACSTKEVAFDTLETARTQARENAAWNAKKFRSEDPRVQGLEFIARGDSTQSPDCPQGDGWASMDFVQADKTFIKVKCSTVSAAVGCMPDEEFKLKAYASEDGKCAPTTKVPFPFRKIVE